MRHFTLQEWEQFSVNMTGEQKTRVMEDHLMECDSCMEMFLSCITEKKSENASEYIPSDFTAVVMRKIINASGKEKRNINSVSRLIYYAAAACITIVLTGMGIFQQLMDVIPQETFEHTANKHVKVLSIDSVIEYGWSDKLMNGTLTLVDSIKPEERRGRHD